MVIRISREEAEKLLEIYHLDTNVIVLFRGTRQIEQCPAYNFAYAKNRGDGYMFDFNQKISGKALVSMCSKAQGFLCFCLKVEDPRSKVIRIDRENSVVDDIISNKDLPVILNLFDNANNQLN